MVCEWAGRYEEYIVVFSVNRDPPRLDYMEMEQVVRTIDARMDKYLKESSTPEIGYDVGHCERRSWRGRCWRRSGA